MASTTSYYAAPQVPEEAKRLFLAAASSMGLDGDLKLPLRPSRAYGSSLVLAREWGLTDIEERLVAGIEASYEPTWDTETGEFTWGMGLNEPHPRGQFNAFLAAAEAAGPGAWEALSAAPLDPCPQIVGVDFPTMAFDRAEWIAVRCTSAWRRCTKTPRSTRHSVSSASNPVSGTSLASMAQWSMPGPMVWSCGCR